VILQWKNATIYYSFFMRYIENDYDQGI